MAYIIPMWIHSNIDIPERQKQGHKDSTSEIYWDSWDTGKPKEKTSNSTSSARSSRSSATFESDDALPPSPPSSDADTDASRLSASDMSDVAPSPKHTSRPKVPIIFSSPATSPLKRSKSDEVNIGRLDKENSIHSFILSFIRPPFHLFVPLLFYFFVCLISC